MLGLIQCESTQDGFGIIACPVLVKQGYQNDVYLHHTLSACIVGDSAAYFNCTKFGHNALDVTCFDYSNAVSSGYGKIGGTNQ